MARIVWWMALAALALTRDAYSMPEGYLEYRTTIGRQKIVMRVSKDDMTQKHDPECLFIEGGSEGLPGYLFLGGVVSRLYDETRNHKMRATWKGAQRSDGAHILKLVALEFHGDDLKKLSVEKEMSAVTALLTTMNNYMLGETKERVSEQVQSRRGNEEKGDVGMQQTDVVQVIGEEEVRPSELRMSVYAGGAQASSREGGTNQESPIRITAGVYVTKGDFVYMGMHEFEDDKIETHIRTRSQWRGIEISNTDIIAEVMDVMNKAIAKVNSEDRSMAPQEEDEIVVSIMRQTALYKRIMMESRIKPFIATWVAQGSVADELSVKVEVIYSEKVWTVASGALTHIVRFIASTMKRRLEQAISQAEGVVSPTCYVIYMPDKEGHPFSYVLLKLTLSRKK